MYADEKFAYFTHALFINNTLHGEVLVKMKFKRGSITVPPSELVGDFIEEQPNEIQDWNNALSV